MTYKVSLALSLTLNVVLICAFFFAPEREAVRGDMRSSEPVTLHRPHLIAKPEQLPESAEVRPSRLLSGPAPSWQQSLPRLRDAGVPNDVLAGMVLADFEIGWQKQLRDFERRYQAGTVSDDERARFEARRDEEQERALRAALGDEGFRQWDKDFSLRDLELVKLQLSSSQTDALYQLRKDRAAKDRVLEDALRNGEIDEADYNERQAAAQSEYDQQFKLVLGDERYVALQNSEEGMEGALRQKLQGLNPADSQIQAMVEAERKWNQQRAALDAARDEEYKQLLGTTDFDQLQKNQDSRYRLLKRYATTWSLSESDIEYIYGSVQHYREQTPHAREQIEQSLIAYFGQERFERLKQNELFNLNE